MEKRIITIVDSASQGRYDIESVATTLGELKAELKANAETRNLQFGDDVTFYEGVTKAEYTDDAAILPDNIIKKGEVTRNLAFMVTKRNKKITSGLTSRKDIYSQIKSNQELARYIKSTVGNYTQTKTEILEQKIDLFNSSKFVAKQKPVQVIEEIIPTETEVTLDELVEDSIILLEDMKALLIKMKVKTEADIKSPIVITSKEKKFTKTELEEMFKDRK